MNHYFAYGSNLWQPRLEERVGGVTVATVGSIVGFDLRFHKVGRDGTGKADAFHTGSPGHRVWGVAYLLTDEQLGALDEIEGDGYRRDTVTVEAADRTLDATTYLARSIDPTLPVEAWYRRFVLDGARSHGLPPTYLETL